MVLGQTLWLTSCAPLRPMRELAASSTARATLLLLLATASSTLLPLLLLVGMSPPLSSSFSSSSLFPLSLSLSPGVSSRALVGRGGWLDPEASGKLGLEVSHHWSGLGLSERDTGGQ